MSVATLSGQEQAFLVTIRTPDLREVEAAGAYLSVDLDVALNGVGTWVLTLPWPHPGAAVLAQPGAGVVIRRTGSATVVASGCWSSWELTEGSQEGGGSTAAVVTVSGPTDEEVLSGDVVLPNPGQDVPTTGTVTATPVAQTYKGAAEDALALYVNTQVGTSALARRQVGLRTLVSAGRGRTGSWRERFTTVLDTCQRIAAPSGLAFRVVQGAGPWLDMVVTVPQVRPEARFSLATGTLLAGTLLRATPDTTDVVVGGGGEGTARLLTRVSGTYSDPVRRRQVFLDQRQTDDVAELRQAGDEELERNPQPVAASVTTVDTPWLAWRTHWQLGDVVSVTVAGVTVTDVVTRVRATEDLESPLRVSAVIGRGDEGALSDRTARALARQVQQTVRR